MMRNKQFMVALVATAACALALSARAQTNILVNDTWRAGNLITPAVPTYAENDGVTGTDADADGDLSSAWFKGGGGTLAVVTNHTPVTGPNIMEGVTSGSSQHWYTYFTQSGSPVTLSAGQEMKVTWAFTPNGVGSQNGNSALVVSLGLTPNGTRVTGNGSLPQANYTNAWTALMNMGTFFGTTPIKLAKWTLAGSGSLAGTAGNYSSPTLASGGASLTTGYANNIQYTYVMDLNMTLSGLQVTETMSGGSGTLALGGSGTISATYLDTSFAGSSVSYDTFVIRPANNTSTANTFDTSLFQVEKISVIPEPSTVALITMGLGLIVGVIRRRRS